MNKNEHALGSPITVLDLVCKDCCILSRLPVLLLAKPRGTLHEEQEGQMQRFFDELPRSVLLRLLPWFVVLALLLNFRVGHAITFDLPYGARKCISEDMPPIADVRGELHVTGGDGDMSLDLFVSDPKGIVFFHQASVNAVKYTFRTGAFDPRTTQVYRFCVLHQTHPNAASPHGLSRRVTLKVEVQSPKSKQEVEQLAKGVHLDKVQHSFEEVSREIMDLISRLDDLRGKEQALSEINEDTSRTIVRITVIAAIFTVATGVLNFLNLKSFFKQKKLA